MNTLKAICVACGISAISQPALAATGEMGTGIPRFGIYSQAVGPAVLVWSLTNPTVPFPAGCSSLVLTPGTMGWDSYKIAIATMTAARLSGNRIRFYAHAERDGGCGVDYVEMMN
jgi:hypothetical protein